jgi:hypothetical protein
MIAKSTPMRVLAVLQNQWFRDPDHVRAILERTPQARLRIIRYALFAGCRTGRILKAALGEEWCQKIVWEEASPEIGGKASSVFSADPMHLRALLDEIKPDIVLALGKIASDALKKLVPPHQLLIGPHPTARGIDTVSAIRKIAASLRSDDKQRAA